ncbi:MAG: DsrE family protein [Gammaproteobacteria bacterium]|nr:DsrE family protein [Gammaproteobacteria bacterium]
MIQLIRKPLPALALALLGLVLLQAQPGVATAQDDGVHRVVYHADFSDPRRFSAMLTSIHNMVTYYENQLADYDVRIVFVAHGIRFVTDDALESTPFATDAALEERRENLKGRLSALNETRGVKLELCDITRKEIGLAEDNLYPAVEMVPSGVVRIAELQRQGFSYIKVE